MKFAIKVWNQHLSRAIQELAKENGYRWQNGNPAFPYTKPIDLFGSGAVIYLDVDHKIMTIGHADNCDSKPFDAKTDWDKIVEAMKPKEPRVIWVNEYESGHLGAGHFTSYDTATACSNTGHYTRTIKFQEVLS